MLPARFASHWEGLAERQTPLQHKGLHLPRLHIVTVNYQMRGPGKQFKFPFSEKVTSSTYTLKIVFFSALTVQQALFQMLSCIISFNAHIR